MRDVDRAYCCSFAGVMQCGPDREPITLYKGAEWMVNPNDLVTALE